MLHRSNEDLEGGDFGAMKIPDAVWHRIYYSFVDGPNILDITTEQMSDRLEGRDIQLTPEQLVKLKKLIVDYWRAGRQKEATE
jgi:hypothetical protein